MSLSLRLYRTAMGVMEPFAPGMLRRRAGKGKEDPERMDERLGHASLPRPPGKLVWLHGVSVGETLSLLTLIQKIRAERPKAEILVTSGTTTSAELLAKRLPPEIMHQYAPVDGPAAVKRFIEHWRPDTGIFAESELWPNLISTASDHGVRLALVSARLTEKSAKGWSRNRHAAIELLSKFDLILPQDPDTTERLKALGVRPGPILNLKLVGAPLPFDASELEWLKTRVKNRKVIVAASTHPGEEELIARSVPPGPLLIVIPRHPDRSAEVEAALKSAGRKVDVRSRGAALSTKADVYLADTLGEMGLFMRLANLVILGGSLVEDIGGHNPLEPARLGAPTLSGPYVHKNEALFRAMEQADALTITAPDSLFAAVTELMGDKARLKDLADNAEYYAAREAAAFDAGWASLKPLLPQ